MAKPTDHIQPIFWTSQEIARRLKFKCEHRHNGLLHAKCYNTAHGLERRVGFLDIEASNLKANFGIILCWCIKPAGQEETISDVITKTDLTSGVTDGRIVESCIKTMRQFDTLIGHYSSRYDFPFIRTRALMLGLDFPSYGEIQQIDTYDMAKRTLCLHSNRQAVIAEALNGKTEKTSLDFHYWIEGLQGNKKALEYILNHCKHDVNDLEKDYNKLAKFVKMPGKSL